MSNPPDTSPTAPRAMQFSLLELLLFAIFAGVNCVVAAAVGGGVSEIFSAPFFQAVISVFALGLTFIGWLLGLKICADIKLRSPRLRALVLSVFMLAYASAFVLPGLLGWMWRQ